VSDDVAKVGDHDYRAFVGPPDQYDLMGASQFSLLCTLGLREGHRLLDIGCGSLRGGRLFITYLAPGCYTGLEPNRWLVEEAIEKQLGNDVLALKEPTFVHNDTFDLAGLDPFDFVVAQSIASHTGPAMTQSLLHSVRGALAPSGIAAVTFLHDDRDWAEEGWVYPGTVRYRRRTIERWLAEAGLTGSPLHWFHPRQTWWAIAHQGVALPPQLLRLQARGAMLAFRQSWDVPLRLRVALRGAMPRRAKR
jgi:cyclopropane fatty-acyl-phospholipid synthase-like methyltransferase